MGEKRMLIVSPELAEKIDGNRGDLSREQFISYLIESRLEQKSAEEKFVTKETIADFERSIKELLRSFLEFFISYGLELGQQAEKVDIETLTKKLQELKVQEAPAGAAQRARR